MAAVPPRLTAAWKLASERNASLLAAGVAFYVFLALFPGMIAALMVYGLVVSPERVADQADRLADALPADAASVISGQLESLATSSPGSLSLGFVIALVLALYSASGGVSNLVTAINAMLGNPSTRNFVQDKLLAVRLTAGAVIFLALVVTLVAVAPPLLNSWIDVPGLRLLVDVARFAIVALAAVVAFGLVFRSAPDASAGQALPRIWSPGVIGAAILWLIASIGFSTYVDNFGSYAQTYGALAGVVVLQLWLWAGFFALLIGAAYEGIREGERPTDPHTGEELELDTP